MQVQPFEFLYAFSQILLIPTIVLLLLLPLPILNAQLLLLILSSTQHWLVLVSIFLTLQATVIPSRVFLQLPTRFLLFQVLHALILIFRPLLLTQVLLFQPQLIIFATLKLLLTLIWLVRQQATIPFSNVPILGVPLIFCVRLLPQLAWPTQQFPPVLTNASKVALLLILLLLQPHVLIDVSPSSPLLIFVIFPAPVLALPQFLYLLHVIFCLPPLSVPR